MESVIKNEGSNRYTVFPIQFPNLWKFYKDHLSTFWVTEEIRLSDDISDWNNKLTDNERFFIKNVLAFFAASDGIVNENLVVNFYNEVQIPEARNFYTVQMMMESIHCVAPETQILTDNGYYQIHLLKDKQVNIWNGIEWSNVKVKQTSLNSVLYKVELSNGMFLRCTKEHKWLIDTKDPKDTNVVFTKNLIPGMIIKPYDTPFLTKFKNKSTSSGIYNNGFIYGKFYSANNKSPHSITKITYDNNILRWLEGYFDANGQIIIDSTNNTGLITFSYSQTFIQELQLLLQICGIQSETNKVYDYYQLSICPFYVKKLQSIGFSTKFVFSFNNNIQNPPIIRITNVFKDGMDKTYCFNEPKNHTGIFNGILTGQSEQYSLLIDTYILDTTEKNRLFSAVETIPAIKKKADWAIKWIEESSTLQHSIPSKYLEQYRLLEKQITLDSSLNQSELLESLNFLTKEKPNFAQRLLAFVCVEGIFFSGSFCAIYWLKSRGLMPGLSTANQFISRDENLHTEFAIELYKMLENKLNEETVHSIFKEAVAIEKEFITESLPVSLIGMNCNLMSQYIEYISDRWLVLLGYNKIYNTTNPFSFMEMISVNTKSNFFEVNVDSYRRAGVGSNEQEREIAFDDDF